MPKSPSATAPAEPRASRLIAGHTQAQGAEQLEVARRTWQDWERGIARMPRYALRLYRHLAGLEPIPFKRRPPQQPKA